jgi:hypothetical protein
MGWPARCRRRICLVVFYRLRPVGAHSIPGGALQHKPTYSLFIFVPLLNPFKHAIQILDYIWALINGPEIYPFDIRPSSLQ